MLRINKNEKKIGLPRKRSPILGSSITDKTSFMQAVEEKEIEIIENDLTKLFSRIKETGEKLKKDLIPENFYEYKALVAKFTGLANRQSYKIETKEWIRHGRARNIQLIRTIDKKIEKLALHLFNTEKNTLKIASLIGEINGLLVSLRV